MEAQNSTALALGSPTTDSRDLWFDGIMYWTLSEAVI